jgi:hypothetical protein
MFRKLAALPTALLGLLLAHEGAYRLVAQRSAERDILLHDTGHGWSTFIPTIAAFAMIVAAWNAWRQVTTKTRPVSYLEILIIQSIAYSTLEIGERLIAGHSPWPGFSLLLAGALFQTPSALLVWALLRFVLVPVAQAVSNYLYPLASEITTISLQISKSVVLFSTRIISASQGRAPPSLA